MKLKLLIFLMFAAAQSLFASGASSDRIEDVGRSNARRLGIFGEQLDWNYSNRQLQPAPNLFSSSSQRNPHLPASGVRQPNENLNPEDIRVQIINISNPDINHSSVPVANAVPLTAVAHAEPLPDNFVQSDDQFNNNRGRINRLENDIAASDNAAAIVRVQAQMAEDANARLRAENTRLLAQLTAQGPVAAPGQNGAGAQNDVRISLLQAERSALQTWNAQYNVTIANLRRDLQDTGTQRDALLAQRNALLDQIRYNNAIADAQRAQINKSHALQLAFITGASMLLVGYLDSLERKNLIESGLTREQANKTMLVERFSFLFVPTMILGAIAPASFAITYAIPLALSIASVSFDNYHEPDAEKIKKCENIRAIASKNGLVMKGQWGNPPLMQTNNPTIIKELIAAGVDVNETNRFNETALMQTRSPEIAELLIKAGADIEALDLFDRTTPLIGAAQYRGKDLLQMLIEHGANLYATNKDGLTALDIARNEVESCKKDFPLLLKNAQDCVDLLEDAMKNPDKFKKVTRSKDASSSVEKVIESEQKIQGEVRDIYELYTF